MRDDELVVHTNHCLHPELVPINREFSELIESVPRHQRIEQLLGPERLVSMAQVQEALRDHDRHPYSICRHVNDHPQTGFWASVFSVVIEADQGRMHISRGNPCAAPVRNVLAQLGTDIVCICWQKKDELYTPFF